MKDYAIEDNRNASSDEIISCEFCQQKIQDYYTILSIQDEVLEKLGDVLSEGIAGCEYCEGEERSEWEYSIHTNNARDWDDDLNNYFDYSEVPESFFSIFAPLVKCVCGSGKDADLDYGSPQQSFDLTTYIYTPSSNKHYWKKYYRNTSSFLEHYDMYLEHDDFIEFQDFLMKYPMLAIKHRVGEMIYKGLFQHFEDQHYEYLVEGKSKLYRGRARKKDSTKIYTPNEMWSPPEGLPQHGRFNPIGIPVLYVTDEAKAIPYEIHASQDEQIDIVEFQIVKPLKLFDMQRVSTEFEGFFAQSNIDSKTLKKAYLLPNFIGNCCQHIGYDGVKYNGVQRQSGLSYTNYALFIESNEYVHMETIQTYNLSVTITLDIPPTTLNYANEPL